MINLNNIVYDKNKNEESNLLGLLLFRILELE